MRDGDYCIALVWEGHSQGWILFQCEQQLLSYAEHQISDETLGDASCWGDKLQTLKALQVILDEECSEIIERVKRFTNEYELLTDGSTLSCTSQLFNFDDLIERFSDEYQEQYFEEEGLAPTSIRENLDILEHMICGRYDQPVIWI